jgi:hypothetical protein
VGQLIDRRVKTARIRAAGYEDQPISAEKIGILPGTESRFGGQVLLFRLDRGDAPVQPGMMVTASLEVPGPVRTGVLAPRSALVRYAGRTWAYVASGDEEFVRKPVESEHPEPGALFITSAVKPGDDLVIQGAQSLLTRELSFGMQEEEE